MPFDPMKDFFLPNQITRHGANVRNDAGVFEFVATRTTPSEHFIKCVDKNGKAVNVYTLTPATAGTPRAERIRAFWCPYENDRTSYTTLTLLADYMFTATMDGCTFGVGHAAGDGSVTVSHANAQASDLRGDHGPMIAAQKTSVLTQLGRNATLFQPTDYRTRGYLWKKKADVSALTFGVREDKKWVFYAHRYRNFSEGHYSVYKYYETVKIR